MGFQAFGVRVHGAGFRVQSLAFKLLIRFRLHGLGFKAQGSGFRVYRGFRIECVWGYGLLGFRLQDMRHAFRVDMSRWRSLAAYEVEFGCKFASFYLRVSAGLREVSYVVIARFKRA